MPLPPSNAEFCAKIGFRVDKKMWLDWFGDWIHAQKPQYRRNEINNTVKIL